MIGFPFDSRVTFNSEGIAEFDRAVSSIPLRKLIKELFSDGVLPNPSTNMQVVESDGLTVKVNKGFAIVDGVMKLEEEDKTITLDSASTSRIDTIALRLDNNINVRTCEYVIIKGTPNSAPQAPELVREGAIYDIGLANILVNGDTITQSKITDTRYDSNRCGIISSISEFDTSTLYQQVQDDLSRFKTTSETDFANWSANQRSNYEEFANMSEEEFTTWFNKIKGQLSEDVAGKLQLQIDDLGRVKADKTELVPLQEQIDILNHIVTGEITSNPFEVTFENLDGLEVNGYLDEVNNRLYI